MLTALLSRLPGIPPSAPVTRKRRAVQLLVAAALLPATTLGPAALRAHAADEPIRIPLHTVNTTARLLGVSTAGVAVAQSSPEAENSEGTVYSGSWSGTLLPRSQAVALRSSGAGMTGTTLAYTVAHPDVATPWTEPRRLDVLTGKDAADPTGGPVSDPVFAGDSWVAEDVPAGLNGNLRRYPLSGSAGPALWTPDGKQLTGFDADSEGTLVSYGTYLPTDDFWKPTGPYRLDLIDAGTSTTQRIASSTPAISEPLLAPDRVVWVSIGSDGARVVNSSPRTGGAVTQFTETSSGAVLSDIAVADDGTIGYLVKSGKNASLRLLRNGKKTDIAVPVGSAGLDTLGNDFYTASGGSRTVAGVYRVQSGKSSRVKALPRPEREVEDWAFDHGVLRYLDRSGGESDELALWTRRVKDATGAPVVSAESSAPTVLPIPAAGLEEPQMSFDAGRGAVPSRKYLMQWDLLDRNRRTGVGVEQTPIPDANGNPVQRAGTPVVSGPYVLLNGVVQRSDGHVIYTEPVPARQAGQDALFGSRLVYGLSTDAGSGQVWSVDAEDPSPVRLASAPCDHAPETATWGGLSAWTSCDGQQITIGRSVGGGRPRTVPSGLTGQLGTLGLTMNGTALGWVADGQAYVLNLASSTSTPVALDGETTRIVIDGNSVVREVQRENAFPASILQVDKLPFKVTPSPRLTGQVMTLSFSPDGDGQADTWPAQFDTTAPLATASLRFVSIHSKAPVRTLTTTKVSDGSVRLAWDGLSSTGRKAAKGPYQWTLIARDGSGRKVTTNGRAAITGTVWIG